jgi:hypothetical protein
VELLFWGKVMRSGPTLLRGVSNVNPVYVNCVSGDFKRRLTLRTLRSFFASFAVEGLSSPESEKARNRKGRERKARQGRKESVNQQSWIR